MPLGLQVYSSVSVGLTAVCGAILNNVLDSRLAADPDISDALRQQIIRSSFDLPKNLTSGQMDTVMQAYVPVRR